MRRELNDSEKQGRVDCRSALRLGERQPSPRQLVVPGGMEVMGLYDPTHEAWPRCPHDGKMLQPLESWVSTDTNDEVPWVCTDPLCNYTEYHSSEGTRIDG